MRNILAETTIESLLEKMKRSNSFITLALLPPDSGRKVNKMTINGGRSGEFYGISREFYDRMAKEYDSRK